VAGTAPHQRETQNADAVCCMSARFLDAVPTVGALRVSTTRSTHTGLQQLGADVSPAVLLLLQSFKKEAKRQGIQTLFMLVVALATMYLLGIGPFAPASGGPGPFPPTAARPADVGHTEL